MDAHHGRQHHKDTIWHNADRQHRAFPQGWRRPLRRVSERATSGVEFRTVREKLSVAETRVDLLHLLEDLRDAYPGAIEETILTEIVANALDSGATLIRLTADSTAASLTIIDNGSGMPRRDLRRYHDLPPAPRRADRASVSRESASNSRCLPAARL